MKCVVCGRAFREGVRLVPVQRYVVNEKRGDFVGSTPVDYIHLTCIATTSGGNTK